MGRREAPIPDGPLHDFAQGLRDLRANAPGRPTYRELSRRAKFSPSALSDAAAGRRLPTWPVTKAFVAACGGDVEAWHEQWRQLGDFLMATHPELIEAPANPAAEASTPGGATAEAVQHPEPASGPNPHPEIWAAASAGRHHEAAALAASCEAEAIRAFGADSGQACHWVQIRADLARIAGDFPAATRLWIRAARMWLAHAPQAPDVTSAGQSAHWCWQRVTDLDQARELGRSLLEVLEAIPGLDPRHRLTAAARLDALGSPARTPTVQQAARPSPSAEAASGPRPFTGPATNSRVGAPLAGSDPKRIGPYQLVRRLGAGAMGQVFLGMSKAGRPVAVKVIRSDLAEDPLFRGRFAAEISAARRVQGRFTPVVLDADAEAVRPWMATTYIPGPSLGEVVADGGPLPAPVVRALAAGIAEALAAIHAAGVLHRDLKPGNVLLDRDGPKVIDFGVARAADHTQLTRTGAYVGTIPYLAPEQVAGAEVGPTADIFALGSLLAYATTGIAPFGDGSTPDVLDRIRHADPDPAALACKDNNLRDLIRRCLDKNPDRRPTPDQIIDACAGALQTGDWLPTALTGHLDQRTSELDKLLSRRARPIVKLSTVPLILATGAVIAVVITSSHDIGQNSSPPPSVSSTLVAPTTSAAAASPPPISVRDGDDPYADHCGPDEQEVDRRPISFPGGSPYGFLVLFHSHRCAASWGYVYGPNSSQWAVHIIAHRQGDGAAAPSAFSGNQRPNSWGNVLSTRTSCVSAEAYITEGTAQSSHTITDCVQDHGTVTGASSSPSHAP